MLLKTRDLLEGFSARDSLLAARLAGFWIHIGVSHLVFGVQISEGLDWA